MDDDYVDDNEFDDYEYEDAADDWEAEAELEEEKAKADAAAKAARMEKKLATRAPVAKKEEEAEDILPANVQKEVEEMRKLANDIGSGSGLIAGAASVDLLADLPVDSAVSAQTVGRRIAEHLMEFVTMPNYQDMMVSVFESLGKEFTTVKTVNEESAKVHVAVEELKRDQKQAKKKKDTMGVQNRDMLNFGGVEDRGGAATEVDETPW